MIWLRYVAFDHIGEFEAKGWKLYAPMQGNHGTYAVLMIWEGTDEPDVL